MQPPLTIAAAQPRCTAKDTAANARAHAEAVRAARARLVVFPELSLTGYELDARPISPRDGVWRPIVEACAAADALALVGAPVPGGHGAPSIALVAVSGSGVEVAYRKTFLGGEESDRFVPGDGPVALELDGRRVGLGMCKDTGIERHVRDTAALDGEIYVAGLVHRPEELAEQDARGVRIARACDAHVAFASFAGPTGGGFGRTAGTSTIWSPSGEVLDRAGTEPGGLARATIG